MYGRKFLPSDVQTIVTRSVKCSSQLSLVDTSFTLLNDHVCGWLSMFDIYSLETYFKHATDHHEL